MLVEYNKKFVEVSISKIDSENHREGSYSWTEYTISFKYDLEEIEDHDKFEDFLHANYIDELKEDYYGL